MVWGRRWIGAIVLLGGLLVGGGAWAQGTADDWRDVLADARGQTVHFNAWGGSDRINRYIDWVGERVRDRYGITLEHVRITDAADTVARVLAERVAGRSSGGSVDLVWINGENFAAMKDASLLGAPFTDRLPNFALVDTDGKPTTLIDFTVPTEGLESPWGMAQLVFLYDTAFVSDPPRSPAALLAYAEAHPGRVTYPLPPQFHGTTFLKQLLIGLTDTPERLQGPVGDAAEAAAVTAPLWAYLDRLHPHLWRGGRAFPATGQSLLQLLDDGEIDIAFSFNPGEASAAIAAGQLAATVRTYIFDGGTIGNTHFVAIPFNASARAGAMVVANFLLSPEAQARKQNPEIWGDPTVLDLAALDPADRALFDALPGGPATLSAEALTPTLLEPHPSWVAAIEAEWQRRYGS